MVRSSGQHKCGLIFCGVTMLFLGSGITVAGFLNDFLDPYDEFSKPENTYFTHTQYWLGIPMVLGLVTASLVLVLSIFAVILEGPVWRGSLKAAIIISENDCKDFGGRCLCPIKDLNSYPVECDEMKKVTVIYTVMVAFSAIATLVCLFAAFIYFRILGWMLHANFSGIPLTNLVHRVLPLLTSC
ncbi:Hypothetical predicted protein [Paramuricea clavata]|uniref:Uncharacterized protein n=1 Tax=Paramuricea clavata TaxID=317549 RepID=A0A7D9H9Y5_PARCT|nr:Hypothetical predicted protein [Paramuricea clavata]